MINQNDLRIGCIVAHRYYIVDTETVVYIPCIVKRLGDKCGVIHGNDTFIFEYNYEDLQPIILTEKILLDSGFEPNGGNMQSTSFSYRFELKDGYFYVSLGFGENIFSIQKEGDRIKNIPAYETRYIHSLQNAFYSACGFDLKVIHNIEFLKS
jgi:hypothetical protein